MTWYQCFFVNCDVKLTRLFRSKLSNLLNRQNTVSLQLLRRAWTDWGNILLYSVINGRSNWSFIFKCAKFYLYQLWRPSFAFKSGKEQRGIKENQSLIFLVVFLISSRYIKLKSGTLLKIRLTNISKKSLTRVLHIEVVVPHEAFSYCCHLFPFTSSFPHNLKEDNRISFCMLFSVEWIKKRSDMFWCWTSISCVCIDKDLDWLMCSIDYYLTECCSPFWYFCLVYKCVLQSFGVHWCPFGSLARLPSSFE